MKLSLSLLKKYVDVSEISLIEISDILTLAGIEVDNIENEKPSFSNVVAAVVEDVIPHPNADKLKIKNGASIEVHNPDNGKKATATVEISNMVLDFAGQVSKNIVESVEFVGIELILQPVSATGQLTPTLQVPKVPKVSPAPTPSASPSNSNLTPLPSKPSQVTPSRPIPQPLPGSPTPSGPRWGAGRRRRRHRRGAGARRSCRERSGLPAAGRRPGSRRRTAGCDRGSDWPPRSAPRCQPA